MPVDAGLDYRVASDGASTAPLPTSTEECLAAECAGAAPGPLELPLAWGRKLKVRAAMVEGWERLPSGAWQRAKSDRKSGSPKVGF